MRTTIRFSGDLLRRAKARAAESGLSLTAFVEEAVRARVDAPPPSAADYPPLPVSTELGWVQPGVNIDKISEVLERLDDEDGKWR